MRWDHVDSFIAGNRAVTVWMVTGTGVDREQLNYRGCDKILNKDTYWKLVEHRDAGDFAGSRRILMTSGPERPRHSSAFTSVSAFSAQYVRRDREMVSDLLTVACAPVELAETEVPVGEEWLHAERGREAEGLPVAELGAVDIRRSRRRADFGGGYYGHTRWGPGGGTWYRAGDNLVDSPHRLMLGLFRKSVALPAEPALRFPQGRSVAPRSVGLARLRGSRWRSE